MSYMWSTEIPCIVLILHWLTLYLSVPSIQYLSWIFTVRKLCFHVPSASCPRTECDDSKATIHRYDEPSYRPASALHASVNWSLSSGDFTLFSYNKAISIGYQAYLYGLFHAFAFMRPHEAINGLYTKWLTDEKSSLTSIQFLVVVLFRRHATRLAITITRGPYAHLIWYHFARNGLAL